VSPGGAVGDPPQIVASGITVTYLFTDNIYSVGKSNFWAYAEELFDLPTPHLWLGASHWLARDSLPNWRYVGLHFAPSYGRIEHQPGR
jgi:hypothetical protein